MLHFLKEIFCLFQIYIKFLCKFMPVRVHIPNISSKAKAGSNNAKKLNKNIWAKGLLKRIIFWLLTVKKKNNLPTLGKVQKQLRSYRQFFPFSERFAR